MRIIIAASDIEWSCVCRQTRRSVRWPYDADDKTMLVELYVANDYSQVCHQCVVSALASSILLLLGSWD